MAYCDGSNACMDGTATLASCWSQCLDLYGDALKSVDWGEWSYECCCQDKCDTCSNYDEVLSVAIREGFGFLPSGCGSELPGKPLYCGNGKFSLGPHMPQSLVLQRSRPLHAVPQIKPPITHSCSNVIADSVANPIAVVFALANVVLSFHVSHIFFSLRGAHAGSHAVVFAGSLPQRRRQDPLHALPDWTLHRINGRGVV